jgi:hypothetical protein
MPTETLFLGVGGDDTWYSTEPAFYTNDWSIRFGKAFGWFYHATFRFPNVPIPPGATITAAVLSMTCDESVSATTLNARIYGNDVDNAVAPTTLSEAQNLVPTTAYIAWDNVEGWLDATVHESPDLAAVIQEIINRPGWSSGNALQIMILAQASTTNFAVRSADSFEDNPGATWLDITWEEGTALTEEVALDDTWEETTLGDSIEEALTLAADFSFSDTAGAISEDVGLSDAFLPNDFHTATAPAAFTLSLALTEEVLYSDHYQFAATAPMMTATGGMECRSIAVEATIPMMTMDCSLSGGETIGLVQTLPMMTVSSSLLTGGMIAASGSIPMMSLSAAGWENGRIIANLTIPMMSILSFMGPASPTYFGIAMNTVSLAVTEYLAYPFNSFALFNGQYLGAKSTGIHKLTGTTNGGAAIAAGFKLGKIPMEHAKARDIWISGTAGGHMRVSLSVDEGADAYQDADYLLTTLDQCRVGVPRGLKPVYLQIGLANESGSDFEIDQVQILGETLKRKKR